MPYKDYPCPVCQGAKLLDIGQEINEEKLATQECPACSGRGTIHIEYYIENFNNKTWKRMIGEENDTT